jgi:hypothetical protein
MAQLAEAYIHLKPYSASTRKVERLGRHLDDIAARAAERVYHQRIVIDVEIEEGSLRSWVTFSGMLLVYSTIADYKGFKESVREMVNDARTVAEHVVEAFVKEADANKDQIYRTERRLKTPGRLNRLARRLERIELSVDQLSPNDVKAELYQARIELDNIRNDLTNSELAAVQENLSLPNIPSPSQWPKEPPPTSRLPKVGIIEEDQRQPSLFSPEFGFTLPPPPEERRQLSHRPIVYQHRTILDPQGSSKELTPAAPNLLGRDQ